MIIILLQIVDDEEADADLVEKCIQSIMDQVLYIIYTVTCNMVVKCFLLLRWAIHDIMSQP